jgi:hypothetical protein
MATALEIVTNAVVEIKNTTGVLESAKLWIDGSAARQQAAVDAALANGATQEQVAPMQAEVDAMKAKSDEVAAAIAANPGPVAGRR